MARIGTKWYLQAEVVALPPPLALSAPPSGLGLGLDLGSGLVSGLAFGPGSQPLPPAFDQGEG